VAVGALQFEVFGVEALGGGSDVLRAVEPVAADADERDFCRQFVCAIADVEAVHRVGECDVALRVEARDETLRLEIEVALDIEA